MLEKVIYWLADILLPQNVKRRLSIEALQESERKTRAIFDLTYQFIGMLTTDGILIEANRAALEFSGIKASSVLGKSFWETPWWTHSSELQKKLQEGIKKAALGEFVAFEATHHDQNQVLHYIDFSLKPVKDEAGKVIYLIPEGRDITERKKQEQDLHDAYRQLQEAQHQLIQSEKLKMLGAVTSGVAHELKNPLTIIMMGVEYLASTIPNDNKVASQTLRQIENAVGRTDKIITSMLDLARSLSLEMKGEDIVVALEEALVLLQNEIQKSQIRVIKEFNSGLPQARIDKNRMVQALLNLISNAVNAMPQGGDLTLRAYARKFSEAGADVGNRKDDIFKIGETAVVVEIEDNGTGIPEETLGKLFNPFFTTRRNAGATGLGLAIVRNIVDLHEARIEIANRKDSRGVIVTLELKIKE